MTTLATLIQQRAGADPAFRALVAAKDAQRIAAYLNAPRTIANPEAGKATTTQTLAPITLRAVMGRVPPAEMGAAYDMPGFVADVKAAIDAQDREYLAVLLQIAVAKNKISSATAAALAEMLAATVPITTVAPATIVGPSLAEAAGLGLVSWQDVKL